jgi:hypothetical protein
MSNNNKHPLGPPMTLDNMRVAFNEKKRPPKWAVSPYLGVC